MSHGSPASVSFSNISANTNPFQLKGGLYGVTVHATFGGGNVGVQKLAMDGVTWVNTITALTTDGYVTVYLPFGTYRVAVTTATGVYIDVSAVVEP